MQLVLSTYERFLLGYRLPAALEGPCELQRSFTHAAHQGPVRCLAAGGPWVVSGGQDDQLHIYDVARGRDLGFVMNPGDGAVPCLALYTPPGAGTPSHLLSGSDDGCIALWRAGGDWTALKLLRGHKGPVQGLAVHPSGRLALSVGRDAGLRLWGLARGRCSYSTRLEAAAEAVAFSADGQAYALLADRLITLHSVEASGGLLARLQHTRRVSAWLAPPPHAGSSGDDGAGGCPLLLAGLDDGSLLLWDVRAPRAPALQVAAAHASRLRALVAVTPGLAAGDLPLHLASASSDGVVKLWDARKLSGGGPAPPQQLASASTSGRITGMVLSAPERDAAAAAAAGGAAAAAAVGGGGAGAQQRKKKKKQQAQQQQQQQQHQHQQQPQQAQAQPVQQRRAKQPAAASTGKRLKQQKQARQQQPPGGSGAGADGALVPRVVTKVKKRQQQQQQQQAARPGGAKAQRPGGAAAAGARAAAKQALAGAQLGPSFKTRPLAAKAPSKAKARR